MRAVPAETPPDRKSRDVKLLERWAQQRGRGTDIGLKTFARRGRGFRFGPEIKLSPLMQEHADGTGSLPYDLANFIEAIAQGLKRGMWRQMVSCRMDNLTCASRAPRPFSVLQPSLGRWKMHSQIALVLPTTPSYADRWLVKPVRVWLPVTASH